MKTVDSELCGIILKVKATQMKFRSTPLYFGGIKVRETIEV